MKLYILAIACCYLLGAYAAEKGVTSPDELAQPGPVSPSDASNSSVRYNYDSGSYGSGSSGSGSYGSGSSGSGSYGSGSYDSGSYGSGSSDTGSYGSGSYGSVKPPIIIHLPPAPSDEGSYGSYGSYGPYYDPQVTQAPWISSTHQPNKTGGANVTVISTNNQVSTING